MLANALGLLGVVLVVLKIMGLISISWWLVVSPFGLLIVLYFFALATLWGIKKSMESNFKKTLKDLK